MANVTADELRDWCALKSTDIPSDATIEFLRDQCEHILSKDTSTTDSDDLRVLSLMITGAKILKWLAQRCVKSGYVSFATPGGVSINKSPRELLELAKSMEAEYNDFIFKIENVGVAATSFLGNLSADTVQDVKDIFQSVGNVWDFQMKYYPNIKNRRVQ